MFCIFIFHTIKSAFKKNAWVPGVIVHDGVMLCVQVCFDMSNLKKNKTGLDG